MKHQYGWTPRRLLLAAFSVLSGVVTSALRSETTLFGGSNFSIQLRLSDGVMDFTNFGVPAFEVPAFEAMTPSAVPSVSSLEAFAALPIQAPYTYNLMDPDERARLRLQLRAWAQRFPLDDIVTPAVADDEQQKKLNQILCRLSLEFGLTEWAHILVNNKIPFEVGIYEIEPAIYAKLFNSKVGNDPALSPQEAFQVFMFALEELRAHGNRGELVLETIRQQFRLDWLLQQYSGGFAPNAYLTEVTNSFGDSLLSIAVRHGLVDWVRAFAPYYERVHEPLKFNGYRVIAAAIAERTGVSEVVKILFGHERLNLEELREVIASSVQLFRILDKRGLSDLPEVLDYWRVHFSFILQRYLTEFSDRSLEHIDGKGYADPLVNLFEYFPRDGVVVVDPKSYVFSEQALDVVLDITTIFMREYLAKFPSIRENIHLAQYIVSSQNWRLMQLARSFGFTFEVPGHVPVVFSWINDVLVQKGSLNFVFIRALIENDLFPDLNNQLVFAHILEPIISRVDRQVTYPMIAAKAGETDLLTVFLASEKLNWSLVGVEGTLLDYIKRYVPEYFKQLQALDPKFDQVYKVHGPMLAALALERDLKSWAVAIIDKYGEVLAKDGRLLMPIANDGTILAHKAARSSSRLFDQVIGLDERQTVVLDHAGYRPHEYLFVGNNFLAQYLLFDTRRFKMAPSAFWLNKMHLILGTASILFLKKLGLSNALYVRTRFQELERVEPKRAFGYKVTLFLSVLAKGGYLYLMGVLLDLANVNDNPETIDYRRAAFNSSRLFLLMTFLCEGTNLGLLFQQGLSAHYLQFVRSLTEHNELEVAELVAFRAFRNRQFLYRLKLGNQDFQVLKAELGLLFLGEPSPTPKFQVSLDQDNPGWCILSFQESDPRVVFVERVCSFLRSQTGHDWELDTLTVADPAKPGKLVLKHHGNITDKRSKIVVAALPGKPKLSVNEGVTYLTYDDVINFCELFKPAVATPTLDVPAPLSAAPVGSRRSLPESQLEATVLPQPCPDDLSHFDNLVKEVASLLEKVPLQWWQPEGFINATQQIENYLNAMRGINFIFNNLPARSSMDEITRLVEKRKLIEELFKLRKNFDERFKENFRPRRYLWNSSNYIPQVVKELNRMEPHFIGSEFKQYYDSVVLFVKNRFITELRKYLEQVEEAEKSAIPAELISQWNNFKQCKEFLELGGDFPSEYQARFKAAYEKINPYTSHHVEAAAARANESRVLLSTPVTVLSLPTVTRSTTGQAGSVAVIDRNLQSLKLALEFLSGVAAVADSDIKCAALQYGLLQFFNALQTCLRKHSSPEEHRVTSRRNAIAHAQSLGSLESLEEIVGLVVNTNFVELATCKNNQRLTEALNKLDEKLGLAPSVFFAKVPGSAVVMAPSVTDAENKKKQLISLQSAAEIIESFVNTWQNNGCEETLTLKRKSLNELMSEHALPAAAAAWAVICWAEILDSSGDIWEAVSNKLNQGCESYSVTSTPAYLFSGALKDLRNKVAHQDYSDVAVRALSLWRDYISRAKGVMLAEAKPASSAAVSPRA